MRTEKGGSSSATSSCAAHHHRQQQQDNPYVDGGAFDSPPRHAIWSTERRLAMKPPPGAPVKAPRSSSSRPYLPNYSPYRQRSFQPQQQQQSCSSLSFCDSNSGGYRSSRNNNKTLILPSKTIDEDDDDQCMAVSLPFRPTRLSFTFSSDVGSDGSITTDPTTVLLGPTTTVTTPGGVLSWHDDEDGSYSTKMDQDDDDVSPRLFHRFGEGTLWRYESIEIAEDESDAIFRSAATMDDDVHVDNDDDVDDDNRHELPPPIQERFTASPLLRSKDDARI